MAEFTDKRYSNVFAYRFAVVNAHVAVFALGGLGTTRIAQTALESTTRSGGEAPVGTAPPLGSALVCDLDILHKGTLIVSSA